MIPGARALLSNRAGLVALAVSVVLVAILVAISCSVTGGGSPANPDPTLSPTPTPGPGGPQGPPFYTLADLGVSIAYARVDASGAGLLVVDRPDGTSIEIAGARGVFTGIEWSPDGQTLALSFGPTPDVQDIYTVNADGTGLTPLTTGGRSRRPTWSPDGTAVAFSVGTALGQGPIFSTPIANPVPVALSQDPKHDNPAWAPDGSVIAVTKEPGIVAYISPTTGSEVSSVQMLRDVPPSLTSFAWSPDSSSLAGVVARTSGLAIVVLGDNLTSQRQVGGPFLGNPADPASPHPSWVLDGAKIVAASAESGDILLADTAATSQDMPSDQPYAPVQVLIPAPPGTKLTFPAVSPAARAASDQSLV
ncbi:MAG: PD40 domain-containing protein [Chloroflexi bacterium]|nr:PD40 domain-containing protein [Chloroflexota bacterium]